MEYHSLDVAKFGECLLCGGIERMRGHEPNVAVGETDRGRATTHGKDGQLERTDNEREPSQKCKPRGE